MNTDRYVPIDNLKEMYHSIYRAQYPSFHCKNCGDTKPKHGFYPMLSGCSGIIQTSMVECNKCALSDEQYEKLFGEPKSADL